MAKFIKLTRVKEEKNTTWTTCYVYPERKVLLNKDCIKSCSSLNDGRFYKDGNAKCKIELKDSNEDYFVTESFEDIEKQLMDKQHGN